MNIKKQLQKIQEYVKQLEDENAFLDNKVAEFEKLAHPQYWIGGNFDDKPIRLEYGSSHAFSLKADYDKLRVRLAEFEDMARSFVNYEAPDHICRMHFEMMLIKDDDKKDGEK